MAVHEIGSQTVPLTLELAKHFDRMTTLKGDRNPDSARGKARVGWLHQLLADGYFYSPTWSTCVVKGEKGRKYRVDGGHSAGICVQMRPRPDRLEAGQVWRRGDEVFILWEMTGGDLPYGLSFTADRAQSRVPNLADRWVYLGTIRELAGVQR